MANEMLSRRMGQVHYNPIRALLNKGIGDAIPLIAGYPAVEAYEMDVLKEIAVETIEKYGHLCFAYGNTPGLNSLKQSIVDHYLSYRGMPDANIENMIIVTGSTQCFDMTSKVLLTPGDTVLVENPTFVGAMSAFSMCEPNIVGVDSDDIGMNLEDLEAKIIQYHPKFVYVIPTFGNPSGKTLPTERREKLPSWPPSTMSTSWRMIPTVISASPESVLSRSRPMMWATVLSISRASPKTLFPVCVPPSLWFPRTCTHPWSLPSRLPI